MQKDQKQKDLEQIAGSDFIPWETLRGKTVLVTGATGLIGYAVVTGLLYAGREKNLDLKVLALVRDRSRAESRFSGWTGRDFSFVTGIVESLPFVEEPVDYIIHGASQTASRAFVKEPVETIRTAVLGTDNILRLAREKKCSGLVYLSSMEVYGYPPKGHKVNESDAGAFSPLDLRNSYPIGKQLCENLCCGYAAEYGVPASIIRLTQTFGAGVNYNDNRVFAEFGRCIAEHRDIVLKTKGETERCYLYVSDAVTAVLTVLLKGEAGKAYNAADESTYCSIKEMAEMVAKTGGVKVRYELQDPKSLCYPDTLYMDLDTAGLQKLGWRAGGGYTLLDFFTNMIRQWFAEHMTEQRNDADVLPDQN